MDGTARTSLQPELHYDQGREWLDRTARTSLQPGLHYDQGMCHTLDCTHTGDCVGNGWTGQQGLHYDQGREWLDGTAGTSL